MADISPCRDGAREVEFLLDGTAGIERYKSVTGAEDDPALPGALLDETDRG